MGECFPWTPKPLYDLSTLEPEILGEMNDTGTCVVLCEGCDEETKKAMTDAMMPVADEAFLAAKQSGCEAGMLFFTATETSDVVYQLRISCDLGEPTGTPQLVVLDIPDSGAYYVFDGDNIDTLFDVGGEATHAFGKLLGGHWVLVHHPTKCLLVHIDLLDVHGLSRGRAELLRNFFRRSRELREEAGSNGQAVAPSQLAH